MTREHELTDDEYRALVAASRPVRYLVAAGVAPISPEEHANAVWRRVAEAHGVQWDSITPSPRGERFFLAVPVS